MKTTNKDSFFVEGNNGIANIHMTEDFQRFISSNYVSKLIKPFHEPIKKKSCWFVTADEAISLLVSKITKYPTKKSLGYIIYNGKKMWNYRQIYITPLNFFGKCPSQRYCKSIIWLSWNSGLSRWEWDFGEFDPRDKCPEENMPGYYKAVDAWLYKVYRR